MGEAASWRNRAEMRALLHQRQRPAYGPLALTGLAVVATIFMVGLNEVDTTQVRESAQGGSHLGSTASATSTYEKQTADIAAAYEAQLRPLQHAANPPPVVTSIAVETQHRLSKQQQQKKKTKAATTKSALDAYEHQTSVQARKVAQRLKHPVDELALVQVLSAADETTDKTEDLLKQISAAADADLDSAAKDLEELNTVGNTKPAPKKAAAKAVAKKASKAKKATKKKAKKKALKAKKAQEQKKAAAKVAKLKARIAAKLHKANHIVEKVKATKKKAPKIQRLKHTGLHHLVGVMRRQRRRLKHHVHRAEARIARSGARSIRRLKRSPGGQAATKAGRQAAVKAALRAKFLAAMAALKKPSPPVHHPAVHRLETKAAKAETKADRAGAALSHLLGTEKRAIASVAHAAAHAKSEVAAAKKKAKKKAKKVLTDQTNGKTLAAQYKTRDLKHAEEVAAMGRRAARAARAAARAAAYAKRQAAWLKAKAKVDVRALKVVKKEARKDRKAHWKQEWDAFTHPHRNGQPRVRDREHLIHTHETRKGLNGAQGIPRAVKPHAAIVKRAMTVVRHDEKKKHMPRKKKFSLKKKAAALKREAHKLVHAANKVKAKKKAKAKKAKKRAKKRHVMLSTGLIHKVLSANSAAEEGKKVDKPKPKTKKKSDCPTCDDFAKSLMDPSKHHPAPTVEQGVYDEEVHRRHRAEKKASQEKLAQKKLGREVRQLKAILDEHHVKYKKELKMRMNAAAIDQIINDY